MPDDIISLGLGGRRPRQHKGETARSEAPSDGANSPPLGVTVAQSELDELVAEAISSAEAVQREAERFKDAGGQVGFITTYRINAAVRNAQDAHDAAASLEEDGATLFAEKAIDLAKKATVGLNEDRWQSPAAAARESAAVAQEAKDKLQTAKESAEGTVEEDAEVIRARNEAKQAKKAAKKWRKASSEERHRSDIRHIEETVKEGKGVGFCGIVSAIVVALFLFFVVLPLGGFAACGAVLIEIVEALAGH